MLDVSTRTLRALIALDEARHFSLATEHCSITQSALSQAIGKLEKQIGLRLVDRDRRRVNFTGEGERMVATAQRLVLELELDEISHDLRDHAALRKGRIVIAVQPSLAAHWLPPTITQFKARYPGGERRTVRCRARSIWCGLRPRN
jgi:LysR family transcriptional regulator, carnitine catabolism transcriptional activator